MTNIADPDQQSDLGLHSFVSPTSPNTKIFRYKTFKTLCIIFSERNILTWFLKVKKISAVFWNGLVDG